MIVANYYYLTISTPCQLGHCLSELLLKNSGCTVVLTLTSSASEERAGFVESSEERSGSAGQSDKLSPEHTQARKRTARKSACCEFIYELAFIEK